MAKETTSTPSEKSTTKERRSARPLTPPRGGGRSAEVAGRQGGASLITFFQEARSELRKVTWPTRPEATNLTVAVIGMTVAIALFLGMIDTALDYLVKPLIGG